MGIFTGIEDHKASFDANYTRAGHYIALLRLVAIKQNGSGDDNFVIEQTILHVINDDDGKGHSVGEECSHLIPNHGKGKRMFMGNVKHFIMKVIGCTDEEVTEEIVEGVVDEKSEKAQPFADLVVEWTGRTRLAKESGLPYTKMSYQGVVSLEDRLERGLITEDDFKELKEAEDAEE